jgi:hypothetical protein
LTYYLIYANIFAVEVKTWLRLLFQIREVAMNKVLLALGVFVGLVLVASGLMPPEQEIAEEIPTVQETDEEVMMLLTEDPGLQRFVEIHRAA